MYEDTTAKVITPDGETETFTILAGVSQGDMLAPYIVVIIIILCYEITFTRKGR